jgi:hypothetical protein
MRHYLLKIFFAVFSISVVMGLVPLPLFAVSNDPYVWQDIYEQIGVYDAWQYTTGSRDVVVAVIDNGFDHFHPDLVENVWINTAEIPGNGIDDDGNGYIDDVYGWNFVPEDTDGDGSISITERRGNNNPRPRIDATDTLISGHGTAVAGLIGATGHNGLFGTGLNWRVSLMNLKVVGNSGSGTIQHVPEAIRYAVDNGADVISMSLVGSTDTPQAIRDAVQYAYERNVIIVAAAGNTLTNLDVSPLYPICSDASDTVQSIIGVSAVSIDRSFARFSNYGSTCIDITAPGVQVSSTAIYNPAVSELTAHYRGGLQGTSFAAPLVAGTAALIRSVYPDLSASAVIEAILSSTSKTPTQDEVLYKNLFGSGLLQVSAALKKASELAQLPLQPSYASAFSVTIPLAANVTMSYDASMMGVMYHINNVPVRYLSGVQQASAVAIHPRREEVYVLEAPTSYGQVVSVYDLSARGLRQIVFGAEILYDGIFFKGEELYAYTLSDNDVRLYQLSEQGNSTLDSIIDLPHVSLVTYSPVLDQFLGVQHERVLFTWSVQDGVVAQISIPFSLGSSIYRFAQKGSHIISFHDTIGVVWNDALRSKRLFLYTPEL